MLNIFKIFLKEEYQNLIDKNESQCSENDNPKEVINKTNYIEEFIVFYTNFNKILIDAFGNNNLFNISFKEVLENIQSNNIKFNNSYILPFYLDKHLKRSSTNNSIESHKLIDSIVNIFPALPDKDVFIDIHRNLV